MLHERFVRGAAAAAAAAAAASSQVPASLVQRSVAPMMDCTDNHFRTLARIISRSSWLYTEMVVADTIVYNEDNLGRFLDFPESHHPIVLQLGGSNVEALAKATRLASPFGYDEINLNCGCPSEKVAGQGCFGARLMLTPKLVAEAMKAIAAECSVPVSVKCRIGVDDADSYEQLWDFISTVSSLSPTRHFIIHARKALLDGISPAKNRSVPPLKYEYVLALLRDFPHLKFTLNGGVLTSDQVNAVLQEGVHGVMVGRAAYSNPWYTLGRVDSVVYGNPELRITRRQVLKEYEEYANTAIGKYGKNRPGMRHVVKPLLQLFYGEPGGSVWRRVINDTLPQAKNFHELMEAAMKAMPASVLDACISSSHDSQSQPPIRFDVLPPVPLKHDRLEYETDTVVSLELSETICLP